LKAAEGALMQMPEDPRLLLELTGMLRGGGPPEAVRKLCRDLLERRPRDFALHAQLLAEWRREDQEGEAVASTERLLTLFPDAAEAHYHAALTLAHFRRESDAERHLQSALRLNPGFATARLELARLLAVAADPAVHDPVMAGLIVDGAEKAMGMKLPQTLEVRAELAWRAGKRAQAVALMEAAVERAREMKLSEVESSLSIRLAGLRREQEQ